MQHFTPTVICCFLKAPACVNHSHLPMYNILSINSPSSVEESQLGQTADLILVPMQLLHQLPHHQQTLTDHLQQQRVLSPTSPHRRSYWQPPCLVTAADLPGSGGSLPITLHLLTKQQQPNQLLLQPLCRQLLLLLICCWA